MSVTSSGPHPRFLFIREFIIDFYPLCNFDVHPLDPPTELLPTSTRWQQWTTPRQPCLHCQLSTVTSYDNTVNNNKLFTTYGSFVITTLTCRQRYSWTSPLTWPKPQVRKSCIVYASCTCQYQIKWRILHRNEVRACLLLPSDEHGRISAFIERPQEWKYNTKWWHQDILTKLIDRKHHFDPKKMNLSCMEQNRRYENYTKLWNLSRQLTLWLPDEWRCVIIRINVYQMDKFISTNTC